MAAITCDICGSGLSMDASGDFAVCGSCGMKHTKDRLQAKFQKVTGNPAGWVQNAMDYVPPIIPKKFTDTFINDEITEINRSIIEINYRLDQLPDVISSASNYASQNKEERMKIFKMAVEVYGKYKEDHAHITSTTPYTLYEEQEIMWLGRKSDAEREDSEKRKLKLELELRKIELEKSLRKSEHQRTESHYQQLLEDKNPISLTSNSLNSDSNAIVIIL